MINTFFNINIILLVIIHLHLLLIFFIIQMYILMFNKISFYHNLLLFHPLILSFFTNYDHLQLEISLLIIIYQLFIFSQMIFLCNIFTIFIKNFKMLSNMERKFLILVISNQLYIFSLFFSNNIFSIHLLL